MRSRAKQNQERPVSLQPKRKKSSHSNRKRRVSRQPNKWLFGRRKGRKETPEAPRSSCYCIKYRLHGFCAQCSYDVPVCPSWSEYLVPVILAFTTCTVGTFLSLVYINHYRAGFSNAMYKTTKIEEKFCNHRMLNIVAHVFVSTISVLTFRMTCFCSDRCGVLIHVALSLVVIALTCLAHTNVMKRSKEDEFHSSKCHLAVGILVYIGLLVQIIEGILSLVMPTFERGRMKSITGVVAYLIPVLAITSGFQQEMDFLTRNRKDSGEYIIFSVGAAFCLIGMLTTAGVIIHSEVTATRVIVVPDAEDF